MTIIDKINTLLNEHDGKGNADYDEFYQKKLKKYGVKHPGELSDEEKKKFFNEIEKEWTSEEEHKKEK
jgi:hypothetical protein